MSPMHGCSSSPARESIPVGSKMYKEGSAKEGRLIRSFVPKLYRYFAAGGMTTAELIAKLL